MFISPTQRLRLYRDFKSIDPRDPFSIIRYYEQHEEALNTLDMDEFMDCALAYINALFEAEEYARHIVMCDFMIEFVMRENVTYFGGEDVFCALLYKKGLSWYRLDEYKNAARVLQSVIKIAPENQQARLILMNCLLQEMPKRRLNIRAWGILILLLSAITAGASGLAIQPFYPDWLPLATYTAGSLFVTGGSIYVWAEVEHYFRCKKSIKALC